jgi:hypothetical protein
MADIRDMTDQQLEVEYGAEWWERATWGCAACGETYDINDMYNYGGQCINCGATELKLFSVRPLPDTSVPF